jgi:hypothetical protein
LHLSDWLQRRILSNQGLLLLNQLLQLLFVELVNKLLVEDWHLLLLEAHIFLLDPVKVSDGVQLLGLVSLEGHHLLGRSGLLAAVALLRAELAGLGVTVV